MGKPLETLTDAETARVKELVARGSTASAAKELRISEPTVVKIMAGLPVHRLTAIAIRTQIRL